MEATSNVFKHIINQAYTIKNSFYEEIASKLKVFVYFAKPYH